VTRRALRRSSRPPVTLTLTARDPATSRTRTRRISVRVLR